MQRTTSAVCGALVLVLSASQIPVEGQAGAPFTVADDPAIRELLVERVDRQHRNAAIVVGIVTADGQRRIVSYGRAGDGPSTPALNGDTVFEIGSVTKVFTAALLAGMAGRGEVKLDDPVARHLPGLTIGSRPDRTITLTDLATHTSRLPFWPSGVPANREGALSMAKYSEAQLFEFLSTFEIPQDVGSKWEYSNIDAGLLGLALARRTGTTYEELVRSRLTGPLEMRSTAVTVSAEMLPRLAVGHDAALQVAPAWNVPTFEGAGSLRSTVNDLLTFVVSLTSDDARLKGALETMLSVQRTGPGFPQALGWWVLGAGPGDGGILAHDGGTLGFSSSVAYDRKSRTTVVVLSNTASAVGDIARHLLRPEIPLSPPPPPPQAPPPSPSSQPSQGGEQR